MSNSIIPLQLAQIRQAVERSGRNRVSLAEYSNVLLQNQTLQVNLANITANRDEYANWGRSLESSLQQANTRIADLEAAKERREAAWKDLSAKQVREYNELVRDYEGLRAEFNDLATKYNSQIDKRKALRTANSALEQKCAAMQAELDALKKSQRS